MQTHYPLNPVTGLEDITMLPWTNGSPAGGIEGSYPGFGLFTDAQTEILATIAEAGITPSGSDLAQLLRAIRGGKLTYYVDTGTANALVVTPPTPHTAYAAGQRIQVRLLNNVTGPCVINVSALGNRSILLPGGGALSNLDYLAGDILDLINNGAAWVCQTPINSAIIDTTKSYTVFGAGAFFADLNVAMTYLNRRTISQSGSVALNLAGAASGSATQFTMSSSIVIDHPNADKITINGAALLAGVPSSANFPLTGNRTTDAGTALTNLRAIFATELHLTSSSSLFIYSGVTINNLLITGDGSGSSVNGVSAKGSGATLTSVSVHGFSGFGIATTGGSLILTGSATASFNGQSGFAASDCGSIIVGSSSIVAAYNTANGISALYASVIRWNAAGTITARENAGAGIAISACGSINVSSTSSIVESNAGGGVVIQGNAFISMPNSTIRNNTGTGVLSTHGTADFGASAISGNSVGAITADMGSMIQIVGGSLSGTVSPAVNTNGNHNSYIAN